MSSTNIGSPSALPGAIILGNPFQASTNTPTGPPAGLLGETALYDGYQTKQGDTGVEFADTLTYSNQTPADLTGATVQFAMRNLTTASPVILTGSGTVTDAITGNVQYAPTASDTSTAGDFTACWIVTYPNGQIMTFPSIGYIDVTIEPGISSQPQLLVDLETVKNYPGIRLPHNDRKLDARLENFIRAAQPLIEQITGPIIPRVFDEIYMGGNNIISLSHRPAVGYGTTPVLNVMAVSEYVGPTEYPLSNVASAALGSIYSYEVNTRLGTITRRTSGGGTIAFPAGPETVHIVYEAGQAQTPANVLEAACELVRINFQTTQATGAGLRTMADAEDTQKPLGFFMPRSVKELLSPMARGPSIA